MADSARSMPAPDGCVAPTIGAALHWAQARLQGQPQLDSQALLANLLNKPRSYLLAWPERELSALQRQRYAALIERRRRGEPTAYLIGHRDFWSLQLKVNRFTLIPRPDTELLVEIALEWLPTQRPCALVDLGTGCGAIAAAIASERPDCRVSFTDNSAEALSVARDNFEALGLTWDHIGLGNWCAALPRDRRFDLIVSNPPYIAEGDPLLEPAVLEHEPVTALLAGATGLDDLTRICAEAPRHLVAGGGLLLEHGFAQGAPVRKLLSRHGFIGIETHRDLAGHERVSGGRLPA
jgi:release factor glutamine methyltransferase